MQPSQSEIARYEQLLQYELACLNAESRLLPFAQFTMPDPRFPADPAASTFIAVRHMEILADVMESVERGEILKVIITTPPRHGKACADDTLVPTPAGWVSHGDLTAGDTVFGPDGMPARVTDTIRWKPDMLRVTFSNGEELVVHKNHEWTVRDRFTHKLVTRETWELARRVWQGAPGKRGSRARWQLPPVAPLQYPTRILEAHPYVLGAWLGDGKKDAARLDLCDVEVFEGIEAEGYVATAQGFHGGTGVEWRNYSGPRPGVRGQLSAQLKQIGVIGKKRIPETYLRSSVDQRLQLLAGLMDTDGHADPKGRCRIVTAEPDLSDDIFDLCASLGFRPYRMEQAPHLSTSGIQGRRPTITIGFQPNMEIPCRVPRKRPVRLAKQRAISIRSIEPATAEGCQSIQVDRADGLYLVGRTLLPTHNTETTNHRFNAWFAGRNPNKELITATYGSKFAGDHADAVADIIKAPRFRQAFPEYDMVRHTKEQITNHLGKSLYFLGRRSPTTGRGGDGILIDDPVKDDKEASSDVFRNDLWEWFTKTLITRRHTDKAFIVLIQCMTGDTPVLMANGKEKPLRDIRKGDRIATYEKGRLAVSCVANWINHGPDRVFEIRMKSGRTVKANARHPFLVQVDGRTEWRRTDLLRKGNVILTAIGENGARRNAPSAGATSRPNARGSATPTTKNTDGLRGIARHRTTRLRSAIENCAIATASVLRSMRIWPPVRAAFAQSASSRPATTFAPIGAESSASITATTAERSGASYAMIAIWQWATGKLPTLSGPPLNTFSIEGDTVEAVTPIGREDVFDIEVERTANFIANGLVSHNTRWNEDDLVGRLSDKTNPVYTDKIADGFEIVELPALAEDDDRMGRKPGEALWPERFAAPYLHTMREADPVGFSALYQGNPTPAEGVFYKVDDLHTYDRGQLPEGMRMHGASDHAVSMHTKADRTCMGMFGLDPLGNAYIMPDLVWKRINSETAIEEMLRLMKTHSPLWWYAERGHISRAIGPILKTRMREESVHCPIIEDQPTADKMQRAQSARARCAQGKILFPSFAPWWPEAKNELLSFPNGRHDDFVDFLSIIGMKLTSHVLGNTAVRKQGPKPGSWAALKAEYAAQDQAETNRSIRAGW